MGRRGNGRKGLQARRLSARFRRWCKNQKQKGIGKNN